VRFSDFADMLGLGAGVHYGRFIASDRLYVDEPLTTLRQDKARLGAEAGRALTRLMAADVAAAEAVTLPVELVVRASTAAPPAGIR